MNIRWKSWYHTGLAILRVCIFAGSKQLTYSVHRINATAVRLTKADGTEYVVERYGKVVRCTCKSYQFRSMGETCKHCVCANQMLLV